jgi:hypothetical protein
MALRDYADIIVTFEAQTVTRLGFGTLLFLTEDTTETAGTVTPVFGSLQEVEDVGYATTSEPYKFAEAAFAGGQDQGFSRLKIAHKSDIDSLPAAWVTGLSDAIATDNDWYALAIESRDSDVIEAVADNIQARQKLFIAMTADADILDAQIDTDIASTILSQNLSLTGVFYHTLAAEAYPEAAWFGRMLPLDPGTANWSWKTLSGIPTDSFSSGQIAALRAKRCNYYDSVAGNSVTYGGYTSEPGIYLDIVRGIDWIQQRMQEDYVAYQASVDRIPYAGGGEIIEAEVVRRRLDMAVDRQVIADNYTVNTPRWQDQDPTDRSSRHFPGITFDATYTGAINSVEIRGTVRP